MIYAKITKKLSNGEFTINPTDESLEELEALISQKKTLLTLQAFDPNKVTRKQQQKAHALIRDINDFSDNDFIENAERNLKIDFCIQSGLPFDTLFSLSNCSRDIARQFITYLVEYCFKYDIPFDSKDLHLDFDTNRKMFLSAVHNRCFVTQSRRQDAVLHIHHVNPVGRNNRIIVDHRNRYYMILTAELHDEIHRLGYWDFCEKWHCGAIKLTDEQILNFGLMSKKQMQERDADPDYEIRDWQLPDRRVS